MTTPHHDPISPRLPDAPSKSHSGSKSLVDRMFPSPAVRSLAPTFNLPNIARYVGVVELCFFCLTLKSGIIGKKIQSIDPSFSPPPHFQGQPARRPLRFAQNGHWAMAEMRARAASPEALEPAPDRKRPRPVATPEVLRDTAMTCASSSSWLQAVPLRPLHERGFAEAAAPERAAGRAASADAPRRLRFGLR